MSSLWHSVAVYLVPRRAITCKVDPSEHVTWFSLCTHSGMYIYCSVHSRSRAPPRKMCVAQRNETQNTNSNGELPHLVVGCVVLLCVCSTKVLDFHFGRLHLRRGQARAPRRLRYHGEDLASCFEGSPEKSIGKFMRKRAQFACVVVCNDSLLYGVLRFDKQNTTGSSS